MAIYEFGFRFEFKLLNVRPLFLILDNRLVVSVDSLPFWWRYSSRPFFRYLKVKVPL
jgi:hypothetical protein